MSNWHKNQRRARVLANAYGLTHDITPAAPQKPTLCACGKPAVQLVNGIPMCAQHALAAMRQVGR